MTSTVTVTAHCAPDKRVHIERRMSDPEGVAFRGPANEVIVLADGETHQQVVYDNVSITVREVLEITG